LIENDKNYYKGCVYISARPSGGYIDLLLSLQESR
jgi:hypothetical protein